MVKRKPKPASETPAELASLNYAVIIRWGLDDPEKEIKLSIDDESFYRLVERWNYVVANRRRHIRETRDTLSEEIFNTLAQLSGLAPSEIEKKARQLSASGLAEVVIPCDQIETDDSEYIGWAARLFPWETALSLLTHPFRDKGTPLTIVRYLNSKHVNEDIQIPTTGLIVRSGPGVIGKHFQLKQECDMVLDSLRSAGMSGPSSILEDPDRADLINHVNNTQPSIIHLTGVDPSAAPRLGISKRIPPESVYGFVLKDGKEYDYVAPKDLADIVTRAAHKPVLIAFSSCFSAPWSAAMAVGKGAMHAIGFQDTVTDAEAMLFFGCFYNTLVRNRWDIASAFNQALTEWIRQAALHSTGVVLWSRRSLLQAKLRKGRKTPINPDARFARSRSREVNAKPTDLTLMVSLVPDRPPIGGTGSSTNTSTSLNYSLLHNDRTPFHSFLVQKARPGKLPPLSVEVRLEVGGEACSCKFSEELPESTLPLELAKHIRLPLIAGLLRQCTESLRTNLYIRVACGKHLLYEKSERVTVLPADEWRDDGEDHLWLPSFVLPRDPEILKIIDAAQRYLRTLLDDCGAGFDGYQHLTPDDSNAADVIDPQVQAIWAALQHDLPVNYINPPPSYTSQSQRLRSPSEIFRGHAATCIDLALLFASCLEFVGIYPVIFLIQGHAFPGYWRSDKAWWGLAKFAGGDGTTGTGTIAPPPHPTARVGQSERWMLTVNNLGELLRYVQQGTLVPFESTYVTKRRGFGDSLEEGISKLHPNTFDAMLDIQSARAANVTPLPLFDVFFRP